MLESSREVFRLEYHTSNEMMAFGKISGGLCLPELSRLGFCRTYNYRVLKRTTTALHRPFCKANALSSLPVVVRVIPSKRDFHMAMIVTAERLERASSESIRVIHISFTVFSIVNFMDQ